MVANGNGNTAVQNELHMLVQWLSNTTQHGNHTNNSETCNNN